MTSILGISGSLRADSLHTELLRLAAEELSGEVRTRALGRAPRDPAVSMPTTSADAPAAVQALVEALDERRRSRLLVARVQRLGAGPAEERDRLGFAQVDRIAAPGQAGARHRRKSGSVRRTLGACRPPQGARYCGGRVVDAELSVPRFARALLEPDDELRSDLRAALEALQWHAGRGLEASLRPRASCISPSQAMRRVVQSSSSAHRVGKCAACA